MLKLNVYPVHQTELLNLLVPEVTADASVRYAAFVDIVYFMTILSVPCEPGYISTNGLETAPRGSLADCRPCGVGSYQPEPEKTYCYLCPYGTNTSSVASTSQEQCISNFHCNMS